MKELYESARKIILDNYKGNLSEETLDVLTCSVMSLFIKDSKLAMERIPSILQKLEIYFGNEAVSKMVLKRFPTYPKDEVKDSDDAMVIRALHGEDGNIDEEWTMFISTSDIKNSAANLVAITTHELIHLCRFQGLVEGETEVKVRDGISTARYNKKTNVTKRKHYYLEEAIVQEYTDNTMKDFYEFIKNEDVSFSPSLSGFKKNYPTKYESSYEIGLFYLGGLTRNKRFRELVDDTFYDTSEPPKLAAYFNETVGSPSAFTTFSRGLDHLVEIAHTGDTLAFDKASKELIGQVNRFLASKKY